MALADGTPGIPGTSTPWLTDPTGPVALPPLPPLLPEQDEARIAAVLKGLRCLSRHDAAALSQGLSPVAARHCLSLACLPITRRALAAMLPPADRRVESVAVVAAHGVFTSPIEWVALAAAAGARVTLKAPARDPALCRALAGCLSEQGLPVHAQVDRALGHPEAVLAFGTDDGVAGVREAHPGACVATYGHRFSAALATGLPVGDLAQDHALYDTRGCMAPTAVFTTGDPEQLARALVPAMAAAEAAWPRGTIDPALGPEWRRRVGLARVKGVAIESGSWAVVVLPLHTFTPVALPRMVTVHQVASADALAELLQPVRGWLSTLAVDDPELASRDAAWARVGEWFPRRCAVGDMQRPPLPRLHDGRSMVAPLMRPARA